MAGRPSKYNDVLAMEILKEYASGKTLVEIATANRMPSRWSIYRWRFLYPDFDKEFLKACECHSDAIVEQAFANVMNADSKEAKLVDVQFKSSSWLASKINRNKYGDKLDIQHNVTIDLSPALIEATQRMASVGAITPKLIEAQSKDL